MFTNKSLPSASCILALAIFLVCGSASLAAAAPNELATVDAVSGKAFFQPLIEYSEVRVTMSGPGGFETVQSFRVGSPVEIALPARDGFYKYELRFTPLLDEQTRSALAEARRDGTEPKVASFGKLLMAGSFSIADGSVVPRLVEAGDKVVLTNANGVIRNALCVGADCPDAPAFGDSSILMMENNNRIKFGDTSASPFPLNDWEIEANSNLSGGANYLGFNDCGTADNDGDCATDLVFAVEAGVRQSALYVESDGDIGVGTSNPVADIHVVTGNTPTLRLDQDASSGFTAQSWDIAGNETNFFVRDVTGGSTLPFRIQPGAPSSSIYISSNDGNVGFGTTSPDVDLHILDTGDNAEVQLETAAQSWKWRANSANNQMNVIDNTNNKTPFRIAANSNNNLFQLGVNAVNRVDITGTLFINGVDNSTPDYVFGPDYQLMSIDEQAQFMWTNRHLPSLEPAATDASGGASFELGARSQGMLEELEKAHIYIDQLHGRVEDLEGELGELRALMRQLLAGAATE